MARGSRTTSSANTSWLRCCSWFTAMRTCSSCWEPSRTAFRSIARAGCSRGDRGNGRMLPLVQDLLLPTSSAGWAQDEHAGLIERGPADLVLALGLIRHLAVPGGIPLDRQLGFFARVGRAAVIEWIPQEDQVVAA